MSTPEREVRPGAYTVEEAATYLCISTDKVYQAVRRRRLRHYRNGRIILIPREAAAAFREDLIRQASGENVLELRRP